MDSIEWAALRVSLYGVIREWVNRESEQEDRTACVGLWTDEIVTYMTDAALHTLKVSADKETWLRENGYVKE